MKNLVKTMVVMAGFGLFSLSASASVTAVQDTVVKDTLKKEVPTVLYLADDEVTYSKIEVAEVPEVVKTAVAAKYAAYVTDEAFKGSDNSYKLVLKRDEKKLTVYYSESGEFQKEETCTAAQAV